MELPLQGLQYLGHAQRALTSRLQADDFTESPPTPPSDDRTVVSRKDDGARAPSLYRRASTSLHNPIDGKGRATWEYGAKSIHPRRREQHPEQDMHGAAGPREPQARAATVGSESSCVE
jgi:hypothetical protein